MTGPPRSVWVEVSTELLAELGDWSEPVQVMISDLRPNGQVEMVLRSTDAPDAELCLLRAWRAEATEVLKTWEEVYVAAGEPGRLGESKAKAVARLFNKREA